MLLVKTLEFGIFLLSFAENEEGENRCTPNIFNGPIFSLLTRGNKMTMLIILLLLSISLQSLQCTTKNVNKWQNTLTEKQLFEHFFDCFTEWNCRQEVHRKLCRIAVQK